MEFQIGQLIFKIEISNRLKGLSTIISIDGPVGDVDVKVYLTYTPNSSHPLFFNAHIESDKQSET